MKKYLSIVGAIIILLLLLVGSLYLKSKSPVSTSQQQINTSKNGQFTVENKEFGYRFNISDKVFGVNNQDYKIIRNGYTTSYYLKTTDPEWVKEGKHYAEVLTIGAVTKKEANSKKIICAKNNIKLQETPYDCLAFDNPLGQNKYLYFIRYPHVVEYPKDLNDINIYDTITEALKNTEFFDPEVEPRALSYDSYMEGFSLNYPSYVDKAFWDPAKNDELGALISLPPELNEEMHNISEKVLLHTVPVQYCALSGKCTPATTNFAINVGSSGKTLKQLQASGIGQSLTTQKIGDKTVYLYEVGAEGEGIIYYFIEGQKNNMYVVALKYMNEQVLTKYKTVSGFTSFAEQKTTAEDIIKSLNFQTPLSELE